MTKKSIAAALTLTLLSLTSISAQATPITWHLSGVTFNDGTKATGSFDYDVDAFNANVPLIPWFSISVMDGINPAFTYDSSTSYATRLGNSDVAFIKYDSTRYLSLTTVSELDAFGGTVALVLNRGSDDGEYEYSGAFHSRSVTGGSFTTEAAAVPEPTTIALLALGLAGFGAVRRRSGKQQ